MLTACDARKLALWDTTSGERIRILGEGPEQLTACGFSADGSRIFAVFQGGTLMLWAAEPLLPSQRRDRYRLAHVIRLTEPHRNGSARFSPDGSRLLYYYGWRVDLLDADRGSVVAPGLGSGWAASDFSPDGLYFAVSRDTDLEVREARSGGQVATLKGHTSRITECAFSPDGRRLATGSQDGTVNLWDVASWAAVKPGMAQRGWIQELRFSPDGTRLLTRSADLTLGLWDSRSGAARSTLVGHTNSISTAVFSPDGFQVLSASEDGTVKLWDATLEADTHPQGHSGRVSACKFSPCGKTVVSAAHDGTLAWWDEESARKLASSTGGLAAALACALSPDGKRVASGHNDGTIVIWESPTGIELARLRESEPIGWRPPVGMCEFSPDGSRLVTGTIDGPYRLWDGSRGTEVKAFPGTAEWQQPLAVFSPEGKFLVTTRTDIQERLVWRDATTGELLRDVAAHSSTISACALSRNGVWLVTASRDGTARLWDARSGDLLQELEEDTGQSGQRSRNLSTADPSFGDPFIACEFSPDSRSVVASRADGTLVWYDLGPPLRRRRLQGHRGLVRTSRFSPDGRSLASSAEDATVRIWRIDSGMELCRFFTDGPCDALNWHPEGNRLVAASRMGTIYFLRLENADQG